jgi:hypothetical protein
LDPQGDLEPYIELMQQAGYSSNSTLYIASGIFSYWSKASKRSTWAALGVCPVFLIRVFYF